MNQIIEVKIKKLKVNFIATCEQFPQCRGIGKTKTEALSNLSNSISKFVEKIINRSLKKVFNSDNFTQIMMDQTTDPYEEVIGYNFNSKMPSLTKNILFKVPTVAEEGAYEDDEENSMDMNDLSTDFQMDNLMSPNYKAEETLENDIYEELTFHQKSTTDSGAIVFGFPLNFN